MEVNVAFIHRIQLEADRDTRVNDVVDTQQIKRNLDFETGLLGLWTVECMAY